MQFAVPISSFLRVKALLFYSPDKVTLFAIIFIFIIKNSIYDEDEIQVFVLNNKNNKNYDIALFELPSLREIDQ